MVSLPNIVTSINERIKLRTAKYPNANICGLSTLIFKNMADKTQHIFPAAIDIYGKSTAIETDQKYPFIVYHRALQSSFDASLDAGNSFGNLKRQTESQDMKLVCMGKRKSIEASPEDFASIIADTLPVELNDSIYINPSLVQFDSQQVFNAEFKNVPFFIDSGMFLFSISYRIQQTHTRGYSCNCIC